MRKKYYDKIDTKRCIGVPQTEYGVCTASDRRNILFTEALGPCMAIIVYDKKTKKALLAHADNSQANQKNFSALLKHFPEDAKLKVYVVGGYSKKQVFGENNALPQVVKDFIETSGIEDVDISHQFERDFKPSGPRGEMLLEDASFQFAGFDASTGQLLLHENDKDHKLPKLHYSNSLRKRDDENDQRIENGDTTFRKAFSTQNKWRETVTTLKSTPSRPITGR